MAQPATGPAEGPSTVAPTASATGVHPVDEKLPPARLVPPQTEGSGRSAGNRLPSANAASSAGIAPTLPLGEIRDRRTTPRGLRTDGVAAIPPGDGPGDTPVAVALGAGIIPLAAPASHAGFPARTQTVLGSGISAGAPAAVVLNLFFHHLGTHSRTAVALKSP